jgi:type IV pilus assembly protein PilW
MPTATVTAAPYSNQPLIQTTASEYKLDVGSNLANFTLTKPSANTTTAVDVALRRYVVRIYFVAVCNVPASGTTCTGASDDNGFPIPTLKMLELGVDPVTSAGPQFNKFSIAEGIENLQLDFGIDTTGDGVADTVSMCDSTTPCTATDFSNVVTVQVNLLARNAETSPNYSDDKTYSLGLKGYTLATNDPYRRHAYSALVRMNNVAMRRE